MYQGKLQQAEMYAQYAKEEAEKAGTKNRYLKQNFYRLWRGCPAGIISSSVFRISRLMRD